MKEPIYSLDFLVEKANKTFFCDTMSKRSKRQNVYGRIAVTHFLRRQSIMTLEQIGGLFNKHHCTILHYIKVHDTSMLYDQEYSRLFTKFENELKSSVDPKAATIENCIGLTNAVIKGLTEIGFSKQEIKDFLHNSIN